MRKLASVRKVLDLKAIENADSIELAVIDGWKCVVKKGEFSVGDLGIYFEIDSVLPEREEFEFLRQNKFRVKTIKLRGQISQGLLTPFEILKLDPNSYELGDDLSDELKVVKYEPPALYNMQEAKGAFPAFIMKTDQERVQNLVDELEGYRNLDFEVTEKLDGSSLTFYYKNGEFGACSRNLEMKLLANSKFGFLEEKYQFEKRLSEFGKNIALQGEMVGPAIQGNIYKLKETEFRIFDVFNIDEYQQFIPEERYDILSQLDLLESHVPILDKAFKIAGKSVDDLLEMAEGKSQLCDRTREGLVFKTMNVVNNSNIHFKVISNRFLLKTGG